MSSIGLNHRNLYKQKILLVDDEEAILVSMSGYLEMNGFDVRTAGGGEEALALCRLAPFDMVVTDLVMDGIGGIELLDEIKRRHPDIGVFILTGKGNMNSAIESLRVGADDYLLKPCDVDELILRMNRFLEKRDALRRVRIYEDFLPICMYCKKIRDDAEAGKGKGEWLELHEYIARKRGVTLTHSCCPDCFVENMKPLLGR